MVKKNDFYILPAPGARIEVRDAEWLVRSVSQTAMGDHAIQCVGISEIVANKETSFLTSIEKHHIRVLDPAETELVHDDSAYFRNSRLYLESLLRESPPSGNDLFLGHKAFIDVVPYQLKPALMALEQYRQRILLADGVGLGKTIQIGILLTELMRRSRAKRILVLTVKSMMTQFQKELWTRFSIPLTRLDSAGIRRVKNHIPSHSNPFYYYDKSIISIDTLKQDSEYRVYLEKCHWDVIVIDEAHNVAFRSGQGSLRARLAKLISTRSDTLIMASATPHDGRADSFASLMNMLDPTAIADPLHYGPEDVKGLFLRRFKKDIQDQVQDAFRKRVVSRIITQASIEEEAVFDILTGTEFKVLNTHRRNGQHLVTTILEKSLFSSPAACLQTIDTRVKTLSEIKNDDVNNDLAGLSKIKKAAGKIVLKSFSKYQKLVGMLLDKNNVFFLDPAAADDRIVIFTERIQTLKLLKEQLPNDLKVSPEMILTLRGDMADVDQQEAVDRFGASNNEIRILIATDVASEGINLHHTSHRLIHFDIPWSLMTFQQRNGRIDRYGQTRTPQIAYLTTESLNEKIRGDLRILDILIKKDEQAAENIGDPSSFLSEEQLLDPEEAVLAAVDEGKTADEFEKGFKLEPVDLVQVLQGGAPKSSEKENRKVLERVRNLPNLYTDEADFFLEALRAGFGNKLQLTADKKNKTWSITAPDELKYRFRYLPREIWPENGVFTLTLNKELLKDELVRSRSEEGHWPEVTLLWEQHPVVKWLSDKVQGIFGRHEAPVVLLENTIKNGTHYFVLSGTIPNLRGQPYISNWFAVETDNSSVQRLTTLEEFFKLVPFDRERFPNTQKYSDLTHIKSLLAEAVEKGRSHMHSIREKMNNSVTAKLRLFENELQGLKERKTAFLEEKYSGKELNRKDQEKRDSERRSIDRIFESHHAWVKQTLQTEDEPYIKVAAVFTGGN